MSLFERGYKQFRDKLSLISSETRKEEENTAHIYLSHLGFSWDDLKDKDILDIGAGPAHFAIAAKRRGINVVSLDIEPGGMNGDGEVPDGVSYIVQDIREGTNFPDDSFDFIVSHGTLGGMDIQELGAILDEAKRLMRQGGEFRFTPVFIPGVKMDELSEEDQAVVKKHFLGELTPMEAYEIESKIHSMIRQKEEELGFSQYTTSEERNELHREASCRHLQQIDPTIELLETNSVWDEDSYCFVLKKM